MRPKIWGQKWTLVLGDSREVEQRFWAPDFWPYFSALAPPPKFRVTRIVDKETDRKMGTRNISDAFANLVYFCPHLSVQAVLVAKLFIRVLVVFCHGLRPKAALRLSRLSWFFSFFVPDAG